MLVLVVRQPLSVKPCAVTHSITYDVRSFKYCLCCGHLASSMAICGTSSLELHRVVSQRRVLMVVLFLLGVRRGVGNLLLQRSLVAAGALVCRST